MSHLKTDWLCVATEGKNTSSEPFEIESLTLQTTRYLPVIKEVQ
ncbi:hypothetical protein MJM28_30800 [Salmonella enterica subsp. enterica serovar Montevideo]|nr:hypothetical protein [Salmonella enterica subsp. enterica serovar Montevideo]